LRKIFLFMGIQGSGKGTQANRLADRYSLAHVSTGDLFRAVMKEQSPLGNELREIVNAGQLVPDDLTSRMVRDRIDDPDTQQGVIFDGYPRTVPQAEALDAMLGERGEAITRVVFFDLPREKAVERLEPRRVCSVNNAHIYHLVNNPPKQEGFCDIDGAALIQRADDTPEAITKRVDAYLQETLPLVEAYESRGLVAKLDATGDISTVTRQLEDMVEGNV